MLTKESPAANILVRPPAPSNAYKVFSSQLILMYLSVLMRNRNDTKLHLVRVFVQNNAHQVKFGIVGFSYTKSLVE